ncbi:MAG: TetR/AcrR family bet gene transcriptional repressor, partial [Paracoccaceae bacterium]
GAKGATVSRIASRAGVSPALAHHYFGTKDRIFLAAMRHILVEFADGVRTRMATAKGPKQRLAAIVDASFDDDQLHPDTVAAWLAFYVEAQRSPEAARLLRVYARRLNSNMVHELRQLAPEATARRVAQGLASLIDGFYIRLALQDRMPAHSEIKALVTDYIALNLGRI